MCKEILEDIKWKLSSKDVSCAIIDGDDAFRAILVSFLDDLGFLVYDFSESDEFIAKYKASKFDVVILTWDSLPIGGTRVVEEMKSCGRPYPALIVECNGGESVSLQLALPPTGFLFKPFDARHFIQVLAKAVGEE